MADSTLPIHSNPVAAAFFVEHLDYLVALHPNTRYTKPEWKALKETLTTLGNWRNKARGLPGFH
jgi:hypothetical protein